MESRRYFFFALLLFSACISWASCIVEDDDPLQPLFQNRVRRFVMVRFKSRKPDPDAVDEYGIGFPGHVSNILKGGTFGVDFKIKNMDKIGNGLSGLWGGSDKKKAEWESNIEERSVDYSSKINPRVNRGPDP